MCLLLLIVNVVLRVALAWRVPLLAHEAYYWMWSFFPAAGYVEHPPFVAWTILVFRSWIDVDSALSLRAGALVAGTAVHLLVFTLAAQLFGRRPPAMLALLFSLALPGVSAVGILMLPDSWLLMSSLLFLNLFVLAMRRDTIAWWLACGVALGFAVLCKLSMLLMLTASATYLCVSPRGRRCLRSPGPYVAVLAAAMIAATYLGWLYQHGSQTWDAFAKRVRLDEIGFSIAKLTEVLLEQIANAGPLLFFPIVLLLFWRSNGVRKQHEALLFAKLHFAVPCVFFVCLGSVAETHPNWSVFAYPLAAIGLATLVTRWPSMLGRGLTNALGAQVALLVVLASLGALGVRHLPDVKSDSFPWLLRHKLRTAQQTLFGWSELAQAANKEARDGDGQDNLVFCEQWKTASLLAWHGAAAEIVNLGPLMPLSFERLSSLTPDYDSLVGRGGIFVSSIDWDVQHALRYMFEDVQELQSPGELTAQHRLFRVRGFRAEAAAQRLPVARQMAHLAEELTSPAYLSIAGSDDARFIQGLYEDVYGRTPTAAEVSTWVQHSRQADRRTLSQQFITGAEFWQLRGAHGDEWITRTSERVRSRTARIAHLGEVVAAPARMWR